jgi:o-succinylbenzoate synthase
MKAIVKKLDLKFIRPGKTSRGILYTKPSWFFFLENNGRKSIGECSVIPGLNREYDEKYESRVMQLADRINKGMLPDLKALDEFPSIRFGLECALQELQLGQEGILFPSSFTRGETGIPINGLIWMDDMEEMKKGIREKLSQGFKVLKLKIGALDFQDEVTLLEEIREEFTSDELEIRLDANGAFTYEEALENLDQLMDYNIHSVEQPIKCGSWDEMARLCETSPVDIALDEELIGIYSAPEKNKMLAHIQPQYIVIKPSFAGGFEKAKEWIRAAEKNDAGWWVTSALESNIGLNAIAQWVATLKTNMVQGLGTGQVFSNNIPSPLHLEGSELWFDPEQPWKIDFDTILE